MASNVTSEGMVFLANEERMVFLANELRLKGLWSKVWLGKLDIHNKLKVEPSTILNPP